MAMVYFYIACNCILIINCLAFRNDIEEYRDQIRSLIIKIKNAQSFHVTRENMPILKYYFPNECSRIDKLIKSLDDSLINRCELSQSDSSNGNINSIKAMSDLFRLKVQQIYSILSKISDCNEKERSKSLDVIKSLIEQLTSIDMQQVLYQT